jgi:uncharacterized repeat protein (TIGR01451 family)
MVSPAFACHPQGTIIKYVQDETTSSAVSDANNDSSAVTVHPNDTLKYVITVSNNGAPASNGDDDMETTVMTDTLPAGVSLVSNPSQRTVSANIGTLKPGQSATETYAVTVTSTQNDTYITNEACFTGNSIEKGVSPQSGCDVAVVKVVVPPTPTPTPTPVPTPTPTPTTPTPTVTTTTPTVLPNTGAGNYIVPAAAVSILAYLGYFIRLKLRTATR